MGEKGRGRRSEEVEVDGRCCCGDVATCNGNKTCLCSDHKRDEQTDRRTDRQSERQTDVEWGRLSDGQTDRQSVKVKVHLASQGES